MSHNLTVRNGRVEMAYREGVARWHGLGNKLEAGATIEAWQQAAGMDWRILRSIVRFATDRDGTMAEYPDKHVLFRSDTLAALSDVSAKFKIVQPTQVLEFFRDLAESVGAELETAGTLFGGTRFWAQATIGKPEAIHHDQVKAHLLVSTACDGTMKTNVRYVNTIVVCNNTLQMANREGKAVYELSHRSEWNPDTAKLEIGIGEARESFADAMAQFRRLAATRMSDAEMVAATGRLLVPGFAEMDTKTQGEALTESRAAVIVGTLATRPDYQIGGKGRGLEGSAYGWLNAVTEYVDHHTVARGANAADNRVASAWFGKGATLKTEAYKLAIQMADGSVEYRDADRTLDATLDTGNDGAGLLASVLANTPAC